MFIRLCWLILVSYSLQAVETYQLIIHFAEVPAHEEQHKQWVATVNEGINLANQRLHKDGYLGSVTTITKESAAVVTRQDRDAGHFTVRLPVAIPRDKAKEYLQQAFQDKNIAIHVTYDAAVRFAMEELVSARPVEFSLTDLRNIKNGVTIFNLERELKNMMLGNEKALQAKQAELAHLKKVQSLLYWYQEFPTTGLRNSSDILPPYPFLPHMFSLWDLAPHKGAGVKVAVLDTGIAAFTFSDDLQYRKNRDLMMLGEFGEKSYNIASADGLDPLHELIDLMERYVQEELFDHHELENLLPGWIKEFILDHRDNSIRTYLVEKGKKNLVDLQGRLTKAGEKALETITIGEKGISPKSGKATFTIKNLLVPAEKNVIAEFVPTEWQELGHGSHVASIINGGLKHGIIDKETGIIGLAPHADVVMIKIFTKEGKSSTSCVLAGVKKAIEHEADILNLSLVLEDTEGSEGDDYLFDRLFKAIPYVVAGTGNEGIPFEGFPARCKTVTFDVGAFDYRGDIADFSQYTKNKGPKVVAPGVAILGAFTSKKQTSDSWYALLQGTSAASPIVAGTLALILGEFQKDFGREQLLKAIYTSTLTLDNSPDWRQKTLFGVIDIRMALFVLHVLKKIKHDVSQVIPTYDIEGNFDRLLKAINALLFSMPQYYGHKHLDDVSFRHDFMAYIEAAQEHQNEFQQFMKNNFFVPITLNDAIAKTAGTIITLLKNPKADIAWLPVLLRDRVIKILQQSSVNLFPQLNAEQQRLLLQRHEKTYWDARLGRIRGRLS